MAFSTSIRPGVVAVRRALAGSTGQWGRLCRVVVFFPDCLIRQKLAHSSPSRVAKISILLISYPSPSFPRK